MKKQTKKRVSLYVKDVETFRSLANDVIKLYYESYGECPTQAEIVEKSLRIAKDFLSGEKKIKKRHANIEDEYVNV